MNPTQLLAMSFALVLSFVATAWAQTPQCNRQDPQRFMIRKYQNPENPVQFADAVKKSIAYRTKKYGAPAASFYKPKGAVPVETFLKRTSFMDATLILVHQKIIPALKCVEYDLKAECQINPKTRYDAKLVGGARGHNTYHSFELSNHLFGIALDIDPNRNPCCGCTKPTSDHPQCKKHGKTVWERIELTPCWINIFERYGFYWLGDDPVLEDAMHFEFLGDPDQILKK